jgi:ATP-dependent DNA helicase RecQ
MPELLLVLKESFGLRAFRPGQEEAIRSALEGKDVIVIMPTGAGKSLCYQLPAVLEGKLTLVVSPLIALMKDQVDELLGKNIPAAFINSSLSSTEQSQCLRRALAGDYRLLYVSPERFRQGAFLASLSRLSVDRFVVDEAHCISEWGHDFRPDYLRLGQVRESLGFPPAMAVTATATPRVREDIVHSLRLRRSRTILIGFDRPNLYFEVRSVSDEDDKWQALGEYLSVEPGPGILYAGTRWGSDETARFCRDVLGFPCEAYHAGLEDAERTRVQEDFMSGRLAWVAASSAFGLGINKEDVRAVVHLMLPDSLERYYQEAGRAGRDGREARALIFFGPDDERLAQWMIESEALSRIDLVLLYQNLLGQMKDNRLEFGEEDLKSVTGLSEVKLRQGLRYLEELGALSGRRDEKGKVLAEISPDSIQPQDLDAFERKLKARKAIRQEKLSEMIRYAQGEGCRREAILIYFGEKLKRKPGSCCDVCSPPRLKPFGPNEKAVLAAVQSLRWNVGRSLLARILKGSKGVKFLLKGYGKAPGYGALKELSRDEIESRITALYRSGFLKQVGQRYPVLSLSSRGQAALAQGFTAEPRPQSQRVPGDQAGQALTIYRSGIRRDPSSLPMLLSFLSGAENRLRALSASALGKLGITQARESLLEALDDPLPEVRQNSAKALGGLGGSPAIPSLMRILKDPNEVAYTKACAKESIQAIRSGSSSRIVKDCLTPENVLTVLTSLDVLPGKLTRSMFAKLLSGSPGETAYQKQFHRAPQRGQLRSLNWEDILEILDVLRAQGWIEFSRGRLIRLSLAGQRALADEKCVAAMFATPPERLSPRLSSEELRQRVQTFFSSGTVKPLRGTFDEGYVLGLHGRYRGGTYERTALGEKVYRYKYEGDRVLLDPLAQEAVAFLQKRKSLARVTAVLAVPSSICDRPYDPMSLLASRIAELLKVQDMSQVLVKARKTNPQKEINTLAKKRVNVRGAFHILEPERLKGQSLLILDDLYDSGITLNEVCQTVRKAGAKAVYALALTRTIHVEK